MLKRPAGERSPSTVEETASTKRAKHGDGTWSRLGYPTVITNGLLVATENTASSLRTWNREQIAGKTVQVTAVLYWNPLEQRYFKLALDDAEDPLANFIANDLDVEYLSESDHIDAWRDLLMNPQYYIKKRWCVGRALNEKEEKFLGKDTVSSKTTCATCIQ